MDFKEAEKYLLSLGNEVLAMKLGLENVTKLFAELGDPQENYTKVQVAGTNGKGSVCAFLNSICVTAGMRTGMYTSPHLISITERVQIDGVPISESEFAQFATKVRRASEALVDRGELESVPTFFEQVTAIALVAFAEAKVELAILETGLGGRLDATTAANAEIAAITRIDIDHQQYLGETIEEIATEKAAIIRTGSKVIGLRQGRIVEDAIKGRCREVGVEPGWATENITVVDELLVAPWLSATFLTDSAAYARILFANMLGEHQIENASLAIGIVEMLIESGFKIDMNSIVVGMENAGHPGRLESIGRFLLDGAHNVGGAKALRAYLDKNVAREVTLIFGVMEDKQVAAMAAHLLPKAHSVILTKANNPRAVPPELLLDQIPGSLIQAPVTITANVSEALQAAEDEPSDRVVLITGSLYLVGEAREILLRNKL